ncbi:hypothetical protein WMY93_022983 [Mugilogobius chulae]|uniref:Protogenin n=1 Tax=Mugilogobius chulae TaxID=88201 RepID=A0AAW0N7E9_9GOBI
MREKERERERRRERERKEKRERGLGRTVGARVGTPLYCARCGLPRSEVLLGIYGAHAGERRIPSRVLCFSELSFITEPSDVIVLPKQPAVLDCQAHGQPPVSIKWLKNGVRLTESQHIHFLPNGSLYIPKIKHTVEESDEGFYQCLSQNKFGAILSQRSRLTIATISEFLTHPVPMVVTEGSVARFFCAVASNPPATITWELNQSTLPLSTDRITVLPNGILQIHNVQLEDAGQYRCVAANIGSRLRSKEATLTVNQVTGPKPLQRPKIIAGPQNVTVSLHQTVVLECVALGIPGLSSPGAAPTANLSTSQRGLPVQGHHSGDTNYTIAAANLTVLVPPSFVEKPESQTRPRAGTARFMCQAEEFHHPNKLVITQIIPEDDAIYQCVAESEQGSVLSLARLIVVMSEDRPSAPRNIHAETISSSAILLAWERPLYNADKVIAYSIHYMKAEGLNNEEYQIVIGNDTTSYIIDDLEPARNYSFYIVAYMPMGASRMSDQVSQHTLEDVPLRTPELTLTSHSSTDIQVNWQPLPAKLSRGRVSAYRLSYRTATDASITSVELPQNSTEYLLRIYSRTTSTCCGWLLLHGPGGVSPQPGPPIVLPGPQAAEEPLPSAVSDVRAASVTVPSAPIMQLEPHNCTSVVARWQPASDSVPVLGYRLVYHEEDQPEHPTIQLQALNYTFTITGLDLPRKLLVHCPLLQLDTGTYWECPWDWPKLDTDNDLWP